MRRRALLQAAIASLLNASAAFGHGTPIHVSLDINNKLVVDGGVPDTIGFARMLFFENDEDGDPLGQNVPLPPPFDESTYALYEIPGFDIDGLHPESNLSFEVLLRPVNGSTPLEHRTLWHWNESGGVAPAPVEKFVLVAEGPSFAALRPSDLVAPASLLLTQELGIPDPHSHTYLKYAIDNTPLAPAGAYGLFARLNSNFCDTATGCYTPSDPFLIALNLNVDYELMDDAALAINAAALNTTPKPGDYDGNGKLEPADYQFWRERYGNMLAPFATPDGSGNGMVDAADYIVWRDAFGQPAAGAFASLAVPEASGFVLTMAALVCLPVLRCNRGLSHQATISR